MLFPLRIFFFPSVLLTSWWGPRLAGETVYLQFRNFSNLVPPASPSSPSPSATLGTYNSRAGLWICIQCSSLGLRKPHPYFSAGWNHNSSRPDSTVSPSVKPAPTSYSVATAFLCAPQPLSTLYQCESRLTWATSVCMSAPWTGLGGPGAGEQVCGSSLHPPCYHHPLHTLGPNKCFLNLA